MSDELDFDLTEDNSKEIITRKDKKIDSLSEKLGSTEKEKDELSKAKADADARADAAQKEADFFKGFNAVASKYQGASEYQDKIREKAALGLDIEEATMLVMAKEGKYTPPVQEQPLAAGGSASIGITDITDKPLDKYTREEKRAMLVDMEAKGDFKL